MLKRSANKCPGTQKAEGEPATAKATRVYYTERQPLRAIDLNSEQEYLLTLDARHLTAQHGAGIVRGLSVESSTTGGSVLQPGMAIDAFGREILLAAAQPAPGPPDPGGLDLWLVYCRQALPLRRPGRSICGPTAFPRWREFGQIVSTRAAVDAARSSPAEGAVYLGRIGAETPSDIAYAALLGALARDPATRCSMQVGARTGLDRNDFVIKAADGSGALTPRLILDRQGNNLFDGPLTLLSYRACTIVPGPLENSRILVEAKHPGRAGEQLRVKIASRSLPGGVEYKLEFLDDQKNPERLTISSDADGLVEYKLEFLDGQKTPERLTISSDADGLENVLATFNRKSALVRLTLLAQDGGAGRPREKMISEQNLSLAHCGGMLELRAWPDPPTPSAAIARGCVETTIANPATEKAPNILSFLPMTATPQAPPLPATYAILTEDRGKQVEQLRLDLGAKRDNDPTARLSIGRTAQGSMGTEATKAETFEQWLTVSGITVSGITASGNCAVTLISRNPRPTAGGTLDRDNQPDRFTVTGTIARTIRPDLTDPIFTNLLVQAWLSGLRQSVQATTVVELAFEDLPTLIETGKPWSYSIRATNKGDQAITADKLFETRRIGEQTLLENFANQVTIPANDSRSFPIHHVADEMSAGALSIEVMISGSIGKIPWWRSKSTDAPIPVVDPPKIDFSDLPHSAPPGGEWSHGFAVKNVSDRALTLTAASLAEGAISSQLLTAPRVLTPNEASDLGSRSHPGGINADLPMELSIDFAWEHGPTSNVTASRTIRVSPDLQIGFGVPASLQVNTAWSYSLILTNISTASLTIVSLKQRLSSGDFPDTEAKEILDGTSITLSSGEVHTLSVQGTLVPQDPSTTHKVRLTIQAEYKRGARTWKPQVKTTDEINVTDGGIA